MATFREKAFLAVIILAIGAGLLYWAYKYDQKLRHEGVTVTKALFYAGGAVIALIGLAGMSGLYFGSGNIFRAVMFNELFLSLARLAF